MRSPSKVRIHLFHRIDLRDQWDHGHFFVAPGLATNPNLRRGTTGSQTALFFGAQELRALPNNIYLTNESSSLAPHVDTIAMVDCCELSQGAIHGHESANPLRSPGRDYTQKPGYLPMFSNDPVSNFPQGVEAYYSSTPTPATLHNWVQKGLEQKLQTQPALRNGVAFKGVSRSIHTAYHFGAGLQASELDRAQSKDALYKLFPEKVEDLSPFPSNDHAQALVSVLDKIDRRFLASRKFSATSIDSYSAKVQEAKGLLYSGATRTVRVPLSPEETAYWSAGVPGQVCEPSDVKAQIWEQAAFAFKLLTSGMTRTVALEFDYVDVHDERTEAQMRTEAAQAAIPLTRLIESLKQAGIYDRTLIAIYTVDGGRSPKAGSYGNEGKNTIILAGGMIRGGYYGDIRVASDTTDGHNFSYHAPDPVAGLPTAGVLDNSARVPGAQVWRTVMKALAVPDATCDAFPSVQGVKPLSYLLRA